MNIADQDSNLSIETLERLPEDGQSPGDVRTRVRVKSKGFSGEYDEVWFEDASLAAFVEQLAKLDQQRSGVAELRSISPDEFHLRVRASDKTGHLVAQGELQRTYYGIESTRTNSISFEIELDPTSLGAMADAIRRIRDAQHGFSS